VTRLFGVHDQKVDNKGRVLFPSALKRQLSSEIQNGFVLKKGVFEMYLELYPMSEWMKEIDGVDKLNRFDEENSEFIRLFMDGIRILELDDAGRLLIPKDLMIWAGIEKDVVLSASISRIEIWDKAKYDENISKKSKGFSKLAQKVMGGVKKSSE